jgi:hypothetical protein
MPYKYVVVVVVATMWLVVLAVPVPVPVVVVLGLLVAPQGTALAADLPCNFADRRGASVRSLVHNPTSKGAAAAAA